MSKIKAFFLVTAMAAAGPAMAENAQIPWPPESRDFDAPHNWPVSHPAPPINIHAVPAAVVFRAITMRERKAVQRELQVTGYYPGDIDGKWGVMTWDAVNLYSARVGIRDSLRTTAGSLNVFQHIAN